MAEWFQHLLQAAENGAVAQLKKKNKKKKKQDTKTWMAWTKYEQFITFKCRHILENAVFYSILIQEFLCFLEFL